MTFLMSSLAFCRKDNVQCLFLLSVRQTFFKLIRIPTPGSPPLLFFFIGLDKRRIELLPLQGFQFLSCPFPLVPRVSPRSFGSRLLQVFSRVDPHPLACLQSSALSIFDKRKIFTRLPSFLISFQSSFLSHSRRPFSFSAFIAERNLSLFPDTMLVHP